MTTTLQVDRDAREVFNEAAIAVGMGDKDLALAVCRKLAAVETAYELRLRVERPDSGHARDGGAASERAGRGSARRMESRFGGRCAKCTRPFPAGTEILYDVDRKVATHASCGEMP